MTAVWGIHNDRIPAGQLVADGFVSIGWDDLGDLRDIGDDQEGMKAALLESGPSGKKGALPQWAGILRRFAFEIDEGDYVVAPSRQSPVFNIGRVAGPYEFHPEFDEHRHRRPVDWLAHDVPRTAFAQDALYEMGSAMTVFRVRNHEREFEEAALNGAPAVDSPRPVAQRTRYGLLQRTILEVLRDRGVSPRGQVLEEVERRVDFTEYELEPTAKGEPRYRPALSWGSVDMVAAQWIEKTPEGWKITGEGRKVLEYKSASEDISVISGAASRELRAEKRKKAGRFATDRYPLIDEAVKLVGEGSWVTYSDVATVAGSNPSAVGEYVHQPELELEGHYRVLPVGHPPYRDEWRGALEAEGVGFDDRGLPDPRQQVRLGDLREEMDELGLLPTVPRRAWFVRGVGASGRDLVPGWLGRGSVTLSASALRNVREGLSRDALRAIVEEDYSHASYDVKAEKVDDFHAFLTRMQDGHLIVTVHEDRLLFGTLTDDFRFSQSGSDGPTLVRGVSWADETGVDRQAVPAALRSRLKVQRDVVDLTQQLDLLENLLEVEEADAPSLGLEPLALRHATPELANALHVPQGWLQECIDLLADRPQLIFYGPPGTGKTYLAMALAKHLAGENVRLVQFHPSYSYEDFFEGYRPREGGGFTLKPGPLRKIVSQARENPQSPHFLIIDEINRGNLAKVFGELYFLLEYRLENVELLYADEDFNLPENVFIIGTMNTADRSIALVDSAMRRRFAFLPLHPSEQPTSGILRSWLADEDLPGRTADLIEELNRRISDPDFKIGPSYFMRSAVHDEGGLERVWRTSILPLLEEHHFGELDAASVKKLYGLDAIAAAVDTESRSTELPDAPHRAD